MPGQWVLGGSIQARVVRPFAGPNPLRGNRQCANQQRVFQVAASTCHDEGAKKTLALSQLLMRTALRRTPRPPD